MPRPHIPADDWLVEYQGFGVWHAVNRLNPSIRLEAEGEDDSAIYAKIEDFDIERATEAAERMGAAA